MLRVTIDGRRLELEGEPTILAALGSLGVELPALCHDDRLRPTGACRLCVVALRGAPRPVAACTTLLADGMEIETRTPEIEHLRRGLLKLLAHDYPAEALAASPDKPFHRALVAYGLEGELRGAPQPALRDDSHPYMHVDMSQCIDCYRCVRICDELQGQFVWRVWDRGAATRIRPDSNGTLLASSCVSCGACVDTCPTGALEDQTRLSAPAPTAWTRTTCPYCGVGCELVVGARDGRIVPVRPVAGRAGDQGAPLRQGALRVRLRGGRRPDHHADGPRRRRLAPRLVGGGDRLRRHAAARDPRPARARRPSACSARRAPTNEDNYLAQKFARLVVGTNNVDCCARVCHAPSAVALKQMLGTGAATNSFDDIERARTILVCGANPTESHPIVGARIKQAALAGARLIVIDPRRIELAEYADIHLQLRPGTQRPAVQRDGPRRRRRGPGRRALRTRARGRLGRVRRLHRGLAARARRRRVRRRRRRDSPRRAPVRDRQAGPCPCTASG